MMIERVVHQMWFQGPNSIPSEYLSNINSWKERNRDYRYMFWDEENIKTLIKSSYPQYYENWIELNPLIKKCDSARYLILHKFGGIYADLDTYAHKSIDSLISDKNLDDFLVVFSEESLDPQSWKSGISKEIVREHNLNQVIANAVMLSAKHQDFWLDFLDASFEISYKKLLDSFGPWHLSRFFNKWPKKNHIKVLPYQYLLSSRVEECSYVTHSYDATWFDYSKKKPWEV